MKQLLALAAFAAAVSPLYAQRAETQRTRTRSTEAPPERQVIPIQSITRQDLFGQGTSRPAILLTGYWPPTNEMVRQFSTNPQQNPNWEGDNWEGRGYDIYSYFPEFANPNCSSCGKGMGDFEVDYQDTSNDFWPIVNSLQPIAIITFSRGFIDMSWEVEMNQFNRTNWFPDFMAPFQPTPSPPDASVPGGHLRLSALPVQKIVDAVDAANLGLDPFICFSGDGGGYLSEFMAYHGVWYQALHDDPSDPAWCIAGGHVHVGGQISWPTATLAAEVTLRTVIEEVDRVLACVGSVESFCSTSPNSVGSGMLLEPVDLPSLSENSFGLNASGGPASQFGLYFYGTPQAEVPFGNGFRCVGGSTFRLNPPQSIAPDGTLQRTLDVQAPPLNGGAGAAVVGATVGFQLWYRDPAGGGAGFNLSDGLRVTWCP